jgi:hypothetical protein
LVPARAFAEFLSALDDEDPNANRKLPKVISPVDPCSGWTAKANKRVQFGYGLNNLIDVENAVIVDVEATPARTYDEVAATKTMIKQTDERLRLKPNGSLLIPPMALASSSTGSSIAGSRHISPSGTQRDDGSFSRADFRFDKDRNAYTCPKGKLLTTTGRVQDGRTIVYRASTRNCGLCPINSKCTPNMIFRKIPP